MKAIALLLTSVFMLSACTTFKSTGNEPIGSNIQQGVDVPLNEDLVVQNLVFALTQLADTHPLKTTISIKPSKTSLASMIEGRFNDAGYGIQYVESDEGVHYVSHTALKNTSGNDINTTYTIFVGPISIERNYRSFSGVTHPSSVIKVKGAEEQNIVLNDEIFGDEYADTQFKEVHFFSNSEVVADTSTLNTQSVQLPSVETETKKNSFGSFVRQNMREIMESNYESLFDEYEVVQQSVLVFANDSLKIGTDNKKTVGMYVNNFNAETDIMSVIGCSHGRTKAGEGGLAGNQHLALGRANRVKEELLFAGLDQQQIFEEGCWDDEYFDEVMPRRGVVLTHKRLINKG